MFVHAVPRVVEVHGADRGAVLPDRVAGGDRLGAGDVTDVEREAEVGKLGGVAQPFPIAERVHQVAWLGLEGDADAEWRDALVELPHAGDEMLPRDVAA